MKLLRMTSFLMIAAPAMMLADASNRLQGTWLINISFDGTPPPGFPATFPVMHAFTSDGEVIEANSLGSSKGAGLGEWAPVAPWQFRYTLRFFVTDQTGAVIGYAQVKTWIETDHEYSKFEACRFIGDIFAFSGTQLLHSTGSCTGTKLVIDLEQPAALLLAGDKEPWMRYDTIIVGARVAGSATGMLLARRGMKVLLVDKSAFPSDTISTHYVHASGIARLNRWGLLDRLRQTGCPPIHCVHFDFGPFGFGGTPPPAEGGIQDAYAPRRTVLDKLLADAAVEAGCELRQNCRVDEVLSDHGRVIGIRAKSSPEFADIVIGADGPHSLVARTVDAAAYDTRPALSCLYYAYWSGVDVPHAQLRIRPKYTTISFPTHDGLTLALVSSAISEYPRMRLDHECAYVETMPEEVHAGQRETPVVGTADLPNFYRKPFGPGWALAGDAGYDRDPLTAQGISDAFRDAELLSDALCAGAERESALATYEHNRNAETRAIYEFTCQRASYEPLSAAMMDILAAISRSPEDASRFAGIDAGTVRCEDFFHPENITRLLRC